MSYRDRRLARAERLREWADKREQKSTAAFAGVRRIADAIPFGQPILVGHHSERHARRDQDRIWTGMSKGVEHANMAQSMDRRADEIERQAEHAIYADDPDAIERLTAKIAGLEAERNAMKARNVAHRKAHRAELQALSSAYARQMAMPHPSYEIANLGGNISRLRERLRLLSGQTRASQTAAPAPIDAATATARAGLTITAGLTTPSRPGKAPRPVWTVGGNFAAWRAMLLEAGGNWYRGAFSFWDDPTATIEAACLEAESPVPSHE